MLSYQSQQYSFPFRNHDSCGNADLRVSASTIDLPDLSFSVTVATRQILMGFLCSVADDTGGQDSSEAEPSSPSHPVHNIEMSPSWKSEKVTRQKMRSFTGGRVHTSTQSYLDARTAILEKERAASFDGHARQNATSVEQEAARIVKAIKENDAKTVYQAATDNGGARLLPGGHFLSNIDLINQTQLFKVAQALPKGAHLHCHYNSCLEPRFLIEHARDVETMWIKSTVSLATEQGRAQAEIQFQVQDEPLSQGLSQSEGDLFQDEYKKGSWMRYSDFRERCGGNKAAEDWLVSKMLLNEQEVYGIKQTVTDIWLRFDVCTRMMKGLFGYESAFRAYTKACLEDFIKDNILYAEVRPNFPSNVLRCDDGHTTIDNRGMMRIIAEEVDRQRQSHKDFGGIKVIYCCPRSFSNQRIQESLEECIGLKREFPDLICGYDLVGSEDRGYPLKHFIEEFLWFQEECLRQKLLIPFLFHAGETLDTGTDTDENLIDAVLLNAKRIGHGFAITKHPEVLELVKAKGICLETCPISNEVLGLCPTIKGHVLPDLLARNVHCTVNSDNGTFYRSTLSHDFYQVMVGSNSVDLIGWKVLAQWSMQHSCMSPDHKASVEKIWKRQWDTFCQWILSTWGSSYPPQIDPVS